MQELDKQSIHSKKTKHSGQINSNTQKQMLSSPISQENLSNFNNTKTKIGTGKNSQRDLISRMDAHQYEQKIQELLELVEVYENKLENQHEQKLKITNKLKEVEQDNFKYQNKIQNLNDDKLKQGKEIIDLSHKLLDINNKYQSHSEHARNKLDYINKDLDEKVKAVENLNNTLESKNNYLKKAIVINDFTQMDNSHLRNNLETLRQEKLNAEDKIRELEAKLDDMYLTRKSETGLQLEINHLKDDNIRLLNMLKTTEEYKDFAYLAEDCNGGVRYVKGSSIYSDSIGGNSAKCNCSKGAIYPTGNCCKQTGSFDTQLSSKTPSSCKEKCRIKECVYKKLQEDTPKNDSNWVPIEAFKTLNTFAMKYRLNIDDSIAKELLYKLNLIWKQREEKQVQRIRSKYQTEILDLRRRLNNKDSTDEILTKSENKKLKEEVREARLDGPILNKKNDGLNLVDSALKVASTFHKTKSNLEAEILRLKKLVDSKDDRNTQTQNLERLKFNEGALWISIFLI